MDALQMDLSCDSCPWEARCGRAEIVAWLRTLDMLRRDNSPSNDELRELLVAVAYRLKCPACRRVGLHAAVVAEEDLDWPQAVCCELCRQPIPAERLEAIPQARRCAACQAQSDRGSAGQDVDYCPRCGSPMVTRLSRGSGISRYQQVCSSPHCRR